MNKARILCGIIVMLLVYGADYVVEALTHQAWPLEFFALVGAIFLFWLIVKGWGTKATEGQRTLRLSFRRVLGAHTSFFYNGTGTCLRCYMPLGLVKPHKLKVNGLFGLDQTTVTAMCEWCHCDSQMEEHVECYGFYYMRLIARGAQPHYGADDCGETCNVDWKALLRAIQTENEQQQPYDAECVD